MQDATVHDMPSGSSHDNVLTLDSDSLIATYGSLHAAAKRQTKLDKALKDIAALSLQGADGAQLDKTQESKLSREQALRLEFEALTSYFSTQRAQHISPHVSPGCDEASSIDVAADPPPPTTGWSHYLVLDFEATCERNDPTQSSWSEIIEFPCVLMDAHTLKVVDEFSSFVRPTGRPKLTAFCTELTSIKQTDVDAAPPLDDVLRAFSAWLPRALGSDDAQAAVLPVTCGEPDLTTMLPRECRVKGLRVPSVLTRYCNVKVPFSASGRKKAGMAGMLKQLDLRLEGTHHRGIDDARNIARIVAHLASSGVAIDQTGGKRRGASPYG